MQNNPLRSLQRSFHIVLVLSIIGSGCSFISSFMLATAMPAMQQFVAQKGSLMPEAMVTTYEMMFAVPRLFYAITAVLYALSLGGVIMMWSYRRTGFHCYTLAQLLVMLITALFLGREQVAIGDIMITALFIAYYYYTLRQIEKLQEEAPSDTLSNPPADNEDAD